MDTVSVDVFAAAGTSIVDSFTVNTGHFTPSDTAPPVVESTSIVATATTNSSRQFNFEMDEPPLGVDLADFTFITTGSVAVATKSVSVFNNTIRARASGISGAGTLAVRLNENSAITDAAGNGNGVNGYVATATTDEAIVTVDAPPEVLSQTAYTEIGGSRRFRFQFNADVLNASLDDFELTSLSGDAAGVADSLAVVSGTFVDVTFVLSGTGTYRIDLKAGTDITDDEGNGNGNNGFVPAYTSGSTFSVDLTPPDVPSTPDMAAASDTGASDSDNVTNISEILFTGTGDPGSTVYLVSDNAFFPNLGNAVVSGAGTWSITSSQFTQPGSQNISAYATGSNGVRSANSASLPIEIDMTAPNSGTLVLTAASDTG